MCGKGTPARVRLFCSCSHALLTGTVLVLALVAWFAWTHLPLLLGMAGLVAAGTFAAVRYLMRFAVPVHHQAAQPAPSPAPATTAPSLSELVAEAQAIVDAAFDARMQP